MKSKIRLLRHVGLSFVAAFATTALPATAQTTATAIPVTVDNFVRAETDMYFSRLANHGGFGTLHHTRDLMPIEHQAVIRANRDTLYSAGVFDLDAGPVTVRLPDAGKRLRSIVAINEDENVPLVAYGNGPYTFTRKTVGTRYVLIGVRTMADVRDPADMATAHALQDGITTQQAAKGSFDVPDWDHASQQAVHDSLLKLGASLGDLHGAFGMPDKVSPVRHLIGAAMAWGGNPEKDAVYLNVVPPHNDGNAVYRLKVANVPVKGFWSISVYNDKGYFEPNAQNSYTVNNLLAKHDADGSVTVQFGGCDGNVPNCLVTPPNWNYMVRLYRPDAEVLSGQWKFPEAQMVTQTAQ